MPKIKIACEGATTASIDDQNFYLFTIENEGFRGFTILNDNFRRSSLTYEKFIIEEKEGSLHLNCYGNRIIRVSDTKIGKIYSIQSVCWNDETRGFLNELEDQYYKEYDDTKQNTNIVIANGVAATFNEESGQMEYLIWLI